MPVPHCFNHVSMFGIHIVSNWSLFKEILQLISFYTWGLLCELLHNSHNMKLIIFSCTVQWLLVFSQCTATSTLCHSRTFSTFRMKFRVSFSISAHTQATAFLIHTHLIALGSTVIFTIVSLPAHEHGVPSPLLRSF